MGEYLIYKPSWKNTGKYSIYLRYFKEYLKYGDFKSLSASLNYVFNHRLPSKDYTTRSGLGQFIIRKHTTDFQFINYAYEKAIKDYFTSHINDFDVFIDVGACIGEYDIWLAKLGKRCIAIEPVNYQAVVKNVALNKMEDKIKVFRCGIGSKKERVYFEIPDGVTSSSHIDRDTNKEPNVDIEPLDELYKQFNLSPDDRIIMKLDVEGMEAEVLEGAKEFIRSRKNISIIYEHFQEDNFKNDRVLQGICPWTISELDEVNQIAVKR